MAAQAVEPAWEGDNKFVFTCKYGWIDVGHFFATALMAFAILPSGIEDFVGSTNSDVEGMAEMPYYMTTGIVEVRQGAVLMAGHWLLKGGLLDRLNLELTAYAQSTGTPEDLESNWQGALFASGILRDLVLENPAYAMGPDHTIIPKWDKFLSDSQAITFSGKSDKIYKILEQDAGNFWGKEKGKAVYTGPRWVRWTELKKQSIAYCLLCDGEKPRPGIPTYRSSDE